MTKNQSKRGVRLFWFKIFNFSYEEECLSDITRLSIQVKITIFGVITVSIEARTVNVCFYYDLSALEQTLWGIG